MYSQTHAYRLSRDALAKRLLLCLLLLSCRLSAADPVAQSPLFLGQGGTPLVMLSLERDHKLYYEAYNDASDLNGDGVLDIRYNPQIDYYGYFDSHKCYTYSAGLFTPAGKTATKKCTGNLSGQWSGDLLNYLTTSRMDALRRVLYGGSRSTDSATATILERSFIPQDAHSWGKEYTSTAADGYDIAEYAPLSQPTTGTRHVFANTTLYGTTSPLLRVLENSQYRVWEWLSIERPVAGAQCATGNNSRSNCVSASTRYEGHPNSQSDFDTLVTQFANASHRQGSGTPSNGRIDGTGNPYGDDDYYLNLFTGTLTVASTGDYTFAVDGDDAVEVIIDGNVAASWYGGHGSCNCKDHKGSAIRLSAGSHSLTFRHQERSGGDSYYLYWKGPDSSNDWQIVPSNKLSGLVQTTYDVNVSASTLTDYVVRVKACVSGLLEAECRGYPLNSPTSYKPSGLLQEYGEQDRMAFGLMTGSYTKNTSGGVLRKNISYLANDLYPADQEIDKATGQFTGTVGVIKSVDKLKIVGFGSSYSYDQNCGVPEVNAPLAEGRCRMWGNPTGEIMYEGLRYFAGKTSPTSGYSIASTGNDDSTLGLPLPAWQNPYRATTGGFPSCSRPSQLVIGDINPSHDTDQLPNVDFNFGAGIASDVSLSGPGLDSKTLADTIWAGEYGASTTKSLFIGQSGSNYDGAPSAKTVTGFGNIRGLVPEEPTRQGGYYSASVALYGKTTDLSSAAGSQKADTFSVVLASPLPHIEFPIDGKTVSLVPFGKTVGGCGSISRTQGSYQPTNTIVDFYVDTVANTNANNANASINGGRPYAKFRINFEDSEYGSDHDMDAITEYVLTLNASGALDVTLTSSYAAGSCIQHMGYVISGTTADGIYLEVRDPDTGAASDVDYFLDTPNTSGTALPTTSSRTFTPGTTTAAAFVAHDPLWYAAKWGGFIDANKNNKLDSGEWDTDNNGSPDNYFLVTDAGKLKDQLGKAFQEIAKRNSSSSSVATNSTSAGTDTLIYQARFNSGDWTGQVLAYHVCTAQGGVRSHCNSSLDTLGSTGLLAWDTGAAGKIPAAASRHIYSFNPLAAGASKGIEFLWPSLNPLQQQTLDGASYAASAVASPLLNYLRGDQSNETTSSEGTYRPRKYVLGDIVNSDPLFVGTYNYAYETLPGAEGSSYLAFRARDSYKNRRKMLYVAANDGMLHGLDANTGSGGGREIFAYLPNAAISPELVTLASPGYTHAYFNDGSPQVGDAYFGDDNGFDGWHSVLVGAMGGAGTTAIAQPAADASPADLAAGVGGKGVYALDVTNPDAFANAATGASKVMWEFTSRQDADLGYTLPQPAIARLYDGHWGAIVANGYNSANGHAILFILNLQTGSVIKKIDTCPNPVPVPTPSQCTGNGLSAPVVVDADNDKIVDYVYAGDLHGNLWKISLTSGSAASWGVAYAGAPLFVAKDAAATPAAQPITAKPQAAKAAASGQTTGFMVYFGTGKYYAVGDNILSTTPQTQTFYGIWDRCDKTSAANCDGRVSGRSVLQQQSILYEGTSGTTTLADGTTVAQDARVTSNCAVAYGDTAGTDAVSSPCTNTANRKGWYLDLLPPTLVAQGEQVVSPAVLRGGRAIFPTLIPSPDPCTFGGTSWLMELDQATGARLAGTPFDINRNGAVDANDNIIASMPSGTGGTGGGTGGSGGSGGTGGSGGSGGSGGAGGTGGSGGTGSGSLTDTVTAASGIKSKEGIIKTPSIISCGTGLDCKYSSGTSGNLMDLAESAPVSSPGRRLSWRQLR